jgi:thiol-disulfide isomerase/thioredoxin
MLAAMEKLLKVRPTSEGESEVDIVRQSLAAIVGGADRVLAHPQATAEQKEEAYEYKISILFQGAVYFGIESYVGQLEALAKQLTQTQPKNHLAAMASSLAIRAKYAGEDGMYLLPGALPAVEQFLANFPGDEAAVGMLEQIAIGNKVDSNGKVADEIKAYELISKNFPDHELSQMVPGILRRLKLTGQQIELKGKLSSGQPINLSDYKGKVVLVDFWATWCGPCMAELPNLRRVYDAFHAKGFEIVGVPLDDEPEALHAFLEQSQLPWPQIAIGDKPDAARGIAEHYGINAIPIMFLIDKDGTVVSTTVRGEELEALVPDLLAQPTKTAAKE